jgi:[CysO sulfur-carrier protein]-S-L-cysteine hydrolase
MRELQLSQEQWEMMRRHAEACAPLEACGLLAGRDGRVSEVLTITNELRSQTRFRMDASEQIRAFAAIDEKGLELVGIFHSHPAVGISGGQPNTAPSETDIDEAAYPVAQLVWSRPAGAWEAHAYWIESGDVSAVAILIDDTKQGDVG